MTESSGVMILVESSRPPRPVSMTATSTRSEANQLKAIAVVISKNEGFSDSKKSKYRPTKSCTNPRGTIL